MFGMFGFLGRYMIRVLSNLNFHLGGGFKYFLFSPLFREYSHFD